MNFGCFSLKCLHSLFLECYVIGSKANNIGLILGPLIFLLKFCHLSFASLLLALKLYYANFTAQLVLIILLFRGRDEKCRPLVE